MAGTVFIDQVDNISYREAVPSDGNRRLVDVLMLHGYPASSYLWRNLLPAVATAGYRALAPDLPGFGDSEPKLPGTWESQVENLDRFYRATGTNKVVLAVHDWGGMIGLRWACDNPKRIAGLVLMNTGFFPEGSWHSLAQALRTEGKGEELVSRARFDTFFMVLRSMCPKIEEETVREYWKTFSSEDRQRNQLDLYRSGEFSKLIPYRNKLAALNVPTKILWGAQDKFIPIAGAYRFHKEIPHSELEILENAGHYLVEDEPELTADTVVNFLQEHFS